jgi:hypothetical protein
VILTPLAQKDAGIMLAHRGYYVCMAAITTRDVPPHVHDALTAAARRQGQSLQQYVLAVLEREARFAANRELLEIDPIGDGVPLPTIVKEIRTARDGLAAS